MKATHWIREHGHEVRLSGREHFDKEAVKCCEILGANWIVIMQKWYNHMDYGIYQPLDFDVLKDEVDLEDEIE